jgi:DNA-binding LytR/AlgR family response regulator
MKWKCLIVDDEQLAARIIRKHAEMVKELEVVAACSNALEAIEIMKFTKIDLLFLDIQLPKILGTSFVRTLVNPPKIIFTTAHAEYATEAFELGAVDYLLKPITFERFLKAVNKVSNLIIPAEMTSVPQSHGFMYFRAERKMVKVFLSDILYVESIKDYINIPPLHVKQSISAIESMLPANLFVRIHRSYIVSINRTTAYTYHDVEIGQIELPIGRQYSAAVRTFASKKSNPHPVQANI